MPAKPLLTWSDNAGTWLREAHHRPSPNADQRPARTVVDLLVIHYISLPDGYFTGSAIERLFCNRLNPHQDAGLEALFSVRVSSHFLIRRHGSVIQFVAAEDRAWHAGESRFMDRRRCNDFSIGVELEGDSRRPFTASQYRKLDALVEALRQRFPLRYVAGHSDIAPARKPDPGPFFDWSRAANWGLARPWQAGRLCVKNI